MPRSTAGFVSVLSSRIMEAEDLVRAIEGAAGFSMVRKFYVYEAAYLLVFAAWENFLEETLLRFLCGYKNSAGVHQRLGTMRHCPNLTAAKGVLFGARTFLLWHDAPRVIAR